MSHRRLVVGNKPKDSKKTLMRLMRYLSQDYKGLTLAIAAAVIATLGGLYGSYAIKPLFNTISAGLNGSISLALMYEELLRLLSILAVVFLVEIVTMYYSSYKMVILSQKTVQVLREEMYYNMLRLKVHYHDQNSTGDLMSRFTNDVDLVSEGLNSAAASIIVNILTLVGTVLVMFIISPILTVATLLILPILALMARFIVKWSRHFAKRQQKTLGELNGFIEESLEGQNVIQLFNHEEKSVEDYRKLRDAYRRNAQFAQITSIMLYPLMANVNTISYAIIGILGGYLAIYHGLSVGELGAFVNMTRQQGKPINEISNQFTILQSALAAAERIFELIDWEQETTIYDMEPLGDIIGEVHFDNVHFGYLPKQEVLKGVSFWAKTGQKIAIVGSTGAGKTTITNLITKFYDIQQGEILVDDHNIATSNRYDLRKRIAMVLQDTHLFSGSIMENIRYGNLMASDEECIAAAKLANADTFIRQLEYGYDTVISGDGEELSQGQKQLLNIARAAVANPSILILDEATSSIDTRTEKLVEKGMDSIMEGRTTFVIAHRLSTVRNANAILVLENGNIIERGDHQTLLALNGRYASLYRGQSEWE